MLFAWRVNNVVTPPNTWAIPPTCLCSVASSLPWKIGLPQMGVKGCLAALPGNWPFQPFPPFSPFFCLFAPFSGEAKEHLRNPESAENIQRESNMHRIEGHHFALPLAPNFPVGENCLTVDSYRKSYRQGRTFHR